MSGKLSNKDASIGIPEADIPIAATRHNVRTPTTTRLDILAGGQEVHSGNVVEDLRVLGGKKAAM